jgi:hypothetical protein
MEISRLVRRFREVNRVEIVATSLANYVDNLDLYTWESR